MPVDVGKLPSRVLLTGGAGTLGRALARRIRLEGWACTLTIYSRDPVKQQVMRRLYPEHRYALGDVCDAQLLAATAYGHDLIIHAAAQKHIPDAERNPYDCYRVNVDGSLNVLSAAMRAGVGHVLGISTDKACHPVNVYGCTKLMMERLYQVWSQGPAGGEVRISLCRYGNVLRSTGSVIQAWRESLALGHPAEITDPGMTRFWLTDQQAIDYMLKALTQPPGTILVPRLKALSMKLLADYALGADAPVRIVGLRPGEKRHEELITPEERPYADMDAADLVGTPATRIWPVTGIAGFTPGPGYTSDTAPQLTRDELLHMLETAE